jgi:hypothetical protein
MKYVFVNGRVAVIVRYWEQHGPVVDGGARVELRRVEQVEGENHRPGAAGLTVLPISDGGLWRADLFMVLSEPGTPCFHYHPKFEHNDVGHRFELDDLTASPRAWIAEQLTDITGTLERAGAGDLVPSLDLDQHRRALPAMLAAVDACLADLPAAIARYAAEAASPAQAASA